MRVQHPWRWSIGVLIVLAVLVAAYAGWLAWSTARSLGSAADEARALKAAALAGDDAATRKAFNDFAADASTAHSRTKSPVWSLVTKLPGYGDDAHGVQTVSRVADELASSGLGELINHVGGLDALLPSSGGIDLTQVKALQAPVAASNKAFAKAQKDLESEDASHFVDSVKLKFRDLQSQIDSAAGSMSSADKALAVLPAMLGGEGKRNYLLVMQNNAEIRATGGLPGAVAELQADNGKLLMINERSGASFGQAPKPVLPLSDEETALFGENLGRYFLDANLTPDFPRSADLWKARWEQEVPGDIDGVLSIDAVTLSYLLGAYGPVTVDGIQLTQDNVVDELLSKVYARVKDPDAQDLFFGKVTAAIFDEVTTGKATRSALLNALTKATNERRILVHDFHDSEQAKIAGTTIAGELTAAAKTTPQVGVYLSDGTLSKMSYYLRYKSTVNATYCRGGVQGLRATMTITSNAPADAATSLPDYVLGDQTGVVPKGDQLVYIMFVAPVGGTVSTIDINSLNYRQDRLTIDGRTVRRTWIQLKPGESVDMSWRMTTGPGQTGDARVNFTPSIDPGAPTSATVTSAC
ncbi:DUF4012 domain-containing protein [Nocardioides sp. Kera G14]|uniref:DUF4012 domain-containing protein n=1 Tax=Nocardioides sp. Kera G14 TaxID=2884264 RepID=UPI001D1200EA|nr:DUF4012 domain-containing protein [Nocardioides sp. Kera G14]UDY23122.1 DUF4012 domain-containing protein [Nocardioides sp. Kera G14]